MTNNANNESINITENAEPVNNEGASADSAAVQLGDEVCFNITEDGTVIIGKPVAGVGQAIEADAQQKYVFNMASDEIASATAEGDDLVVTFDNGSTVTLENYVREFADGGDTLNFINGEVITLASLIEEEQPAEEELEEPQTELREAAVDADQTPEEVAQELAQTEPAAGEQSVAEALAEIEPAAGEAGGGAAGNSGYGYASRFEAQPVPGLDDTGPLGETALEYGITQPSDDLFIEEQEELPPLNPNVEFNNVQVLEDGSVQLLIDAAPVTDAGILTFTITGIPSTWTVTTTDGTYDAGTGTWTYTTTSGAAFNGGPVLSPPADSDVDLPNLSITVLEEDPATERTGTFTGEIDVIVDAVADAPDVDGLDDTGLEGATLDMEIPTALTGEEVNVRDGITATNDGSESITNIVIEAITPGIDLNDYQITNVNGPVTLDTNGNIVLSDRSELDSLQIKANDPDFVGSIDFEVTLNTQENPNDTEFNGTNDTAQATDTFTVTWKPVANPPEVEVTAVDGGTENGYVYEDNSVEMNVTGTLDPDGSGNEILSLTVTGIDLSKLDGFSASNGPDGETWSRVDGGGPNATNASYTITLNNGGANYTGTFTFTPDAQSDLDLTNMEVVASAFEPATNTTANSAPDAFDVYVDADADADALDLEVTDASGDENTTLDIQVSNVFTGEELIDQAGGDTNDGSEAFVNIVLSSTADLENYFIVTNDNGTVTFDSNGNIVFNDKSDLNGLQIKPVNANYSGSIAVDVTLNTAETELNGVDFDNTNNTATDTETVNLSWNPTIDPPSIKVNFGQDEVRVKEDNSVDVDVQADLAASASPVEYLTLTVSGLDLTKLEGGEAGFSATDSTSGASWSRVAGSPDSAASYTITLSAGEAYDGTFSFDPLDQSDLDLTGLSVEATATDDSVSPELSASASDDFFVTVDAVADKPDVDAADNSGEEGAALAVDIDGLLGVDQDGSESIEGYEVRGDQAEMNGFTFTVNGVERAPVNGVVPLSVAEVDALVVTPKDSTWTGDLKLDAVVLSADNPNDGEYDTGDNTNSDPDPFTLTWTDDDEPIIAKPDAVTVDETNFTGTPRETADSGDVSVEFGDDYSGAAITGNGQFDIGGATSNGDVINVSFDSATNTYTGSAVTGADVRDVFTLTINQADIDAADGSASSGYTFTLLDTIDHPVDGPSAADHNDALEFTFGFNATDSDGDVANDTITVNVLDDGPKANDDVNAFQAENAQQDYNIVMVLDVSGSMAGEKLALLKSSVSNLLQDYNGYNGGDVKVHIVPFANSDQSSATFTVTNGAELDAAQDFINGLSASGSTNYEAPMQSAIDWLQGGSSNDPISGADTYTYFLSDGEPNRYVNQSGNDVSGSAGQVMNEISGSDGSKEIEVLQNLSAEVTGVGIGVNSTTLARLAQIGTGGKVLDVQDASDLYDALSNDNPVKGSTSGNVITGVNGGAGAADGLSEDLDTTVTEIGFGANKQTVAADGSATIDGAYGTLTMNSDGSYTYKLTTGETSADTLQEVFDYVITDGDGDTALANLTINITIPDDQPANLQTEVLVVDESDFAPNSGGQDVDSGTVTADFGNDGPGSFVIGNPNDVTFTGAKGGILTSNGVAIAIAAVGNSYVGTANGETIFTLDLNETTGDYDFTLTGQMDHANADNPNDIIEMKFGVSAVDGDGDSLDGTITVNVYDDGPVARDDFNDYTVSDTNLSTDGNVISGVNGGANAADTESQDVVSTVTAVDGVAIAATGTTTINGDYGVLEIAADGSYTYTLNANAEDMAAIEFGEPNDFPDLAERQALDGTDTDHLGVYNGALDASSVVDGSVSFVSEGASYDNSFGYYTVAADGTLQAATIAVENGNAVGNANIGNLNADAGESLAFFIIAEGFDTNNGYNGIDLNTGSLEFVYKYGTGDARAANIADDGGDVSLVYTSAGGDQTVLQGSVYHTNERGTTNNLNADGTVRVVSGLADGDENTLRIGFEDLPGLGDRDYNDFIFDVQLNSNFLKDDFEYTLTDGDGDTSTAMLEVCADLPADDTPINLRTETLKVDETDFNIAAIGEDSDSGKVSADFGNDGPGSFEVGNANDVTFSGAKDNALTSNGVAIDIATVGNSYVGTAGGETIFTLALNENSGEYDFTLTGQIDHADASDPNDVIDLAFDVIGTDADGDTLGGKINVKVYDDAPVAQNDINAYQVEQVGKDFNIVMVLDVSGSMAGNQLALLKSSVSNLLDDYNGYSGGDVKVHLVPFASSAQAAATYTVTNGAELDAAKNFVNGLSANGFTNYEAPMQSAIDWLQGNSSNDPISGADTYAYFVSDGEPNRYIDSNGDVESGDAGYVMGEISGNDGYDEIQTLKDLTTEVVGVGIGVNSNTLALLGQIDSDGNALDVQDANDLYASLSAINPIKGSADGNVITGENGGAGAEDALSQDAETLVTAVDGNAVNVGSDTVVEGNYGTLTINANGDYSYELKQDIDVATARSLSLDPAADYVDGDDASITENGITVTGFDQNGNESDLRWMNTSVGNGIVVIGAYDNKVYPYGESLEIGFEAANSVEISIGELGSNDDTGKGIDYVVHFADGTSETGEYGFVQSEIVNGVTFFTLSSSDYGEKLIEGVSLKSVDTAHDNYGASSFLLNNVTVNYQENTDVVDTFTYTITDADGDISTADLTLYGNQQGTTSGNDVLTGNDNDNFLYGGAGEDVIYGEAGHDTLVGGGGDDTLTGGEGGDTFVFTNKGDADTVTDFDASEGDVLDISDVLSGFDALADSLEDFVFTASNGSDTDVYVDTSGGGDQAAATLLVTLEGVDVTLANLDQSGSGGIIV